MACCILIAQGCSAEKAMDLVEARRAVAEPRAFWIAPRIRKFEREWRRRWSAEIPVPESATRGGVHVRVHVVINPGSGQPQPVLQTLNSVFRAAGVEWDATLTHKSGDAVAARLAPRRRRASTWLSPTAETAR